MANSSISSLMEGGLIDSSGYDPYNHVGKLIRRHENWAGLRASMRDEVFVISSPMMDALQRDFMARPMLSDLVKPRYLGADFGMFGAKVVVTDFVA